MPKPRHFVGTRAASPRCADAKAREESQESYHIAFASLGSAASLLSAGQLFYCPLTTPLFRRGTTWPNGWAYGVDVGWSGCLMQRADAASCTDSGKALGKLSTRL